MAYDIVLSPAALDHLAAFTAPQPRTLLDALETQLTHQTGQLGENPEFLELMRHSWDRLRAEGGIPLAEARRLLKG